MPEPPHRRSFERRTERKLNYSSIPALDRRTQPEGTPEYELQRAQKFSRLKELYVRRKLSKIIDYYEKHNKKIDQKTLNELIENLGSAADKLLGARLVKARDLAERDELTGLLTVKKFESLVKMYLYEQPHGTFFFLDVNNLKRINDEKGHVLGDAYLETLADAMTDLAKKYNLTVARIGGDEFAMYSTQPDLNNSHCDMLIEELRASFKSRWSARKLPYDADFASGYATRDEVETITRKDADYKSMKDLADARMYKNKAEMKSTKSGKKR